MFDNYLGSIEGVSLFPVVSLVLFFAVFIAVLIWVLRLDKKYIKKMEVLPLESKNNGEIINENN